MQRFCTFLYPCPWFTRRSLQAKGHSRERSHPASWAYPQKSRCQGNTVRHRAIHRARADDRRRHGLVGQQPDEGDTGGLLADGLAQRLPRLQLGAVPLDVLPHACAPAGRRLVEHPAQQPPAERAPGDDAYAIVLTGGNQVPLDGAGIQIAQASSCRVSSAKRACRQTSLACTDCFWFDSRRQAGLTTLAVSASGAVPYSASKSNAKCSIM